MVSNWNPLSARKGLIRFQWNFYIHCITLYGHHFIRHMQLWWWWWWWWLCKNRTISYLDVRNQNSGRSVLAFRLHALHSKWFRSFRTVTPYVWCLCVCMDILFGGKCMKIEARKRAPVFRKCALSSPLGFRLYHHHHHRSRHHCRRIVFVVAVIVFEFRTFTSLHATRETEFCLHADQQCVDILVTHFFLLHSQISLSLSRVIFIFGMVFKSTSSCFSIHWSF